LKKFLFSSGGLEVFTSQPNNKSIA
jgi:hypothetical protein